jgi:dTDP-4-dehydrorhamnose reductase
MLYLLTGSTGFLGRNLKELLPFDMLCPTHAELDLTDRDKVKEYLRQNKPDKIIHCASRDAEKCCYDNLAMFINLAESKIPMLIFSTGKGLNDCLGQTTKEYVLSKHIIERMSLSEYKHITVIKLWGCFGKYERPTRFFTANMQRIKRGEPIMIDEDKLFSYIWVNDLAEIIQEIEIGESRVLQLIAYTKPLVVYAKILKGITNCSYDIFKKGISVSSAWSIRDYSHSYTGKNNCEFNYTPLEAALKKMWEQFNE